MAISSVTNRVNYQANGTSAVFSFPHQLHATTDLAVFGYNSSFAVVSNMGFPYTLNAAGGFGYTISGTANASGIYPSGFNIVLNSAPNPETIMVLFRSTVVTNNFVVGQNNPIPSTGLNNQTDRLTVIAQRLQDQATRSLRLNDAFSGVFDPTLPLDVARQPGKFLIVNSTATGFILGDQTSGTYNPNTLIYANALSTPSSLPGAGGGLILQSNGSSAPSWAALSLGSSSLVPAGNITGVLTVSNGGTGNNTSYIQYGVMFASSAQEFANTAAGGNDVPLVGNGASAPTFRAINLASGSSVTGVLPGANAPPISSLSGTLNLGTQGSGVLPVVNGGTGQGAPLAVTGILFASTTTQVGQTIPVGSSDMPLIGAVNGSPRFMPLPLNAANATSSLLPTVKGGTGQSNFLESTLIFATSSTQFISFPQGAPGAILQSNGSSAPTWVPSSGFVALHAFGAHGSSVLADQAFINMQCQVTYVDTATGKTGSSTYVVPSNGVYNLSVTGRTQQTSGIISSLEYGFTRNNVMIVPALGAESGGSGGNYALVAHNAIIACSTGHILSFQLRGGTSLTTYTGIFNISQIR